MSYLLYMDESGHDHFRLPYEIRGGLCIHARDSWTFTRRMRGIEGHCFGDMLSNYGSEIKGEKLFRRQRFDWAKYYDKFSTEERQVLCRRFLAQTARGQNPGREAYCAYGQASLLFAAELLRLIRRMRIHAFASIITRASGKRPTGVDPDYVRRDIARLLQRFSWFLEQADDTGIIVLDESDREDDKRFLRKVERYFSIHEGGRTIAKRILPTPLFVGSDMSYPVQAADVLIYAMNTGFRSSELGIVSPEVRPEVQDLIGSLILPTVMEIERTREDGSAFTSASVFLERFPWGK